ncbi:MAG: hypothetical protein ACKOZY_00760, partial [Flavobacteriales bacterium]
MKFKLIFFLLMFVAWSIHVDAQTIIKFNAGGKNKEQQEDDEFVTDTEDQEEVSGLSFGLNLGSYF